MKRSLIWIGSVIGAGAVMALFFGALDKPATPRTINVSGDCLTSAPKDRTAITLRVTTLDKNAAKSMKMATQKMSEITDYLKTLDVKMQTTEFNSYEKTEWNHVAQKSENLGIETRMALEVSSSNPDIIESVLNKFAGQPDIYTENLRMFTSTETLKPILENTNTFDHNLEKLSNKIYKDVAKAYKKLVENNYKSWNQITKIGVGVFITLPITCTALNWVYPRFMEIFFPKLAGVKKAQTAEQAGQQGGNK